MIRSTLAAAVATVCVGALAAPAVADAADDGWHPVQEDWQPYEGGYGLFLPADRYCGDFDVQTTTVFEDVKYRVMSRWDSGAPRETEYTGPLVSDATNQETGATTRYNISGRAEVLQREDGSLARYETEGPVGFGWPTGSVGLPQGFYIFRGHHVVEFPVGEPRRLVVDDGPETDICGLID